MASLRGGGCSDSLRSPLANVLNLPIVINGNGFKAVSGSISRTTLDANVDDYSSIIADHDSDDILRHQLSSAAEAVYCSNNRIAVAFRNLLRHSLFLMG
jgi:hypothetical protein